VSFICRVMPGAFQTSSYPRLPVHFRQQSSLHLCALRKEIKLAPAAVSHLVLCSVYEQLLGDNSDNRAAQRLNLWIRKGFSLSTSHDVLLSVFLLFFCMIWFSFRHILPYSMLITPIFTFRNHLRSFNASLKFIFKNNNHLINSQKLSLVNLKIKIHVSYCII